MTINKIQSSNKTKTKQILINKIQKMIKLGQKMRILNSFNSNRQTQMFTNLLINMAMQSLNKFWLRKIINNKSNKYSNKWNNYNNINIVNNKSLKTNKNNK